MIKDTKKIALVTGSEGHIGRQISRRLISEGYFVYGIDRTQSNEDQTKTAGYKFILTDLESETDRYTIVDKLEHKRIDLLVNNAAFVGDEKMQGWACEFKDQDLVPWRRALEVNLTAPFHLAQLLQDRLLLSDCGNIINISSIYGDLAPDFSIYEDTEIMNPAAYSVSKAGLNQLTRWLASYLGPRIRVNAIAPGGLERYQSEAFKNKYIKRTLLNRMANEDDIVSAVSFLASEKASYITGQIIYVDGGLSST